MPNPDSPNNALPAGTQVGQFIIRQALGAGGFGITYIAYDVHLNRDVVIKENFPSFYASREHDTLTVCPSSTSNTDLFEKSLISFTNEAKMIASLKHPNIVSIFSIFDAYGTVFFAMPYHQGGSLSQFVKAFHQPNYTPLTEEQLRAYLIPILEALQYMHAHNVYHRDIKPDNILIDEKTGDPILIDFGAARELLDDKTQAATIVATFGFAAPEQIMALKVGPYTDLYALAATMYALMTGKIPERGDARLLFEDKHKKLSDDLLMQTRYSRPFLLSIDQALEADWKKRPQTAQEWLDALQRKSSFWTAKRILSLAAILILVIISAIFILPSSNQNQEEIANTPVASNQQQPITKAPATTEPPPATNPAPTKDNKTASTAKPAEPNTNTTKNNPDSFNNLEDWVDFVETTTKVNTNKALQTKDADNTPVATQAIEDFKTPVSQAIYQANINPNAQVKANAKYFIFCWGSGLFKMKQKRHQLLAATMDATEKDPNIQIIHVSTDFPLTKTEQQDFSKLPAIFDVDNNPITENHSYRKITHTDSTAKIPWNRTIETNQKLIWGEHKKNGKVQGDFPMPDEDKKINSPWFLPTGCSPSFFIVDDQGKRVCPQDKIYANLETIWDAYKDLSTLSEEELKLSHDKYVSTSPKIEIETNTPQADQAKEKDKTPVADAIKQANINPKAQVKQNAKYFIFCWGHGLSMNMMEQKRFQLEVATEDATQNDPNIQFVIVGNYVPANPPSNLATIPMIMDIDLYSDSKYQIYLNAIKPDSKVKIPWNDSIEEAYKRQWSNQLSKGQVQGTFPLPNDNKKINIPGFLHTGCNPSFFIIDAQGKRVFPKNETYSSLGNIWDAYKDLSTLPEELLKLSYDRYVTTTPTTDQATPSDAKLLDDISKERTWTSAKNGKQTKGLVTLYDGVTVTMRINNKDIQSPKTNFSKKDQDWLDQHKEAIQQAHASKDKTNIESPNNKPSPNSVAKGVKEANINRKAKIKPNAKYFIFYGNHKYGGKKRQLKEATMDATQKDPNIQFILTSYEVDPEENSQKDFTNIPIVLNTYHSNYYLRAVQSSSKVKIPWNTTIEEEYKQIWKEALNKGEAQGTYPIPDKNKKIDIPGFLTIKYNEGFFILDSQGERVFPKNEKQGYSTDIWDAYKALSTLTEEELTLSYNKYLQTSFNKEDLDWLDKHQKAIKRAKANSSSLDNKPSGNPVADAVKQANINRNADTKIKLKAKYFIFCSANWELYTPYIERYQFLKATIDATRKDPNMELIYISKDFPLITHDLEKNVDSPIILDLSSSRSDYTEAIKSSAKVTLPWNTSIETTYKKNWNKNLTAGTVKGTFPMPDESTKIDIPGFSPTERDECFFILDAQGKRILPHNKNDDSLENIWGAYKTLTTLPEEELKKSYNKHVTKEPETPAKKDTETTPPSPAEAKLLEDVSKERTWTSSKNGKQITGQVIAYDGSNVTIRINNKDVQSPKTNFSNEDQDWLNQHQEAIQQAKINKQKTNGDSPDKDTNEHPVANAVRQLTVNPRGKAKIKIEAKFFIFGWIGSISNSSTYKGDMLTAATINATQKDPHIQFVSVIWLFNQLDSFPKEFNNIPIIFDSSTCSTTDYKELLKAGCQVKIPWNDTIEAAHKQKWKLSLSTGTVRGDFPILKENRRINIPGFYSTRAYPSFFILDSQGKLVFPKRANYGSLSEIWEAYTDITTLPEKELQRIYRKYVNSQLKDDD